MSCAATDGAKRGVQLDALATSKRQTFSRRISRYLSMRWQSRMHAGGVLQTTEQRDLSKQVESGIEDLAKTHDLKGKR